ncbi:MAG: phosphate acyltransferase [Humidesulfovibrio sp.]|nr:phosphate acyltransferase [Humidesulfovibrio sp.]
MDTPRLTSLAQLVRAVTARGRPVRVVIAPCAEEFVLRAAAHAAAEGLAEPIFLGDLARTRAVAERLGLDLGAFECQDCPDDGQAATLAVDYFRQGRADLIMKGLVSTSTILKAVLVKDAGLVPAGGILSHVTVFDAPACGEQCKSSPQRLMLLTDAGVNIRPTLQRKVEILKNALAVARRLGISSPRAAMLAATEKVNYPAMPATLDADIIAKMAGSGEFGDALVAGPLSLDLAVSPSAAAMKGVSGPVAGQADILCTPDIESGNILYKALNSLLNITLASVVVGSRVPVVVPSRGDSEQSKFASIALAAYLAGGPQ